VLPPALLACLTLLAASLLTEFVRQQSASQTLIGMLAALGLHPHTQARWQMGGANGRVGLVDMLTARPAGPKSFDPQVLIAVLTGYASIAVAVEAIKLGARH